MVTVNMNTFYKLTGHLSGTFWFRNVGPNLPKKDISGLKQKKANTTIEFCMSEFV